jgi:ABC-2 type transport system permease protein
MKILSLINKSLKEQIRSFWILLLTLSMGPFFIFVYYLITDSSETRYDIVVINQDVGVLTEEGNENYGQNLIDFFKAFNLEEMPIPFSLQESRDRAACIDLVKNKKADALIVIDSLFSHSLEQQRLKLGEEEPKVEFVGDLTNTQYLISAIYANEILNEYALLATKRKRAVAVTETALGTSASVKEFDILVPGILIVSLIMLMITASIAFVSEVENRTIIRLRLSQMTTFEFLTGISLVQLLVGLVSIFLTLLTAILLGFEYAGSLAIMIVIAALTSLSIISFSLIIAAVTKSANEVLVVGNFPLFLFMFFTGAAFPLNNEALFSVAGYPIHMQDLMSPSHAISALNKTLVMNMEFGKIIPELIAIVVLTILYFLIGAIVFKRRHLKLN